VVTRSDSAFDLLKGVLQPPVSLRTQLQRLLPTSGTLHQLQAPAAELNPGLVSVLAGLRGLAQVIFINNPISGLVLLAAFWVQSPATALLALLGAAAAHGTASQLGLEPGLRQEGIYGFNGVLVGCAIAHFAQLDRPWAGLVWAGLVLVGGALSTLLLEGLRRGLHRRLKTGIGDGGGLGVKLLAGQMGKGAPHTLKRQALNLLQRDCSLSAKLC